MNDVLTQRLSNVLTWIGPIYPISIILADLFKWRNISEVIVLDRSVDESHVFFGLIIWGVCLTINYLMVGSIRLLPWKEMQREDEDGS